MKYLLAIQIVLTLIVAACAVIAPGPITFMSLLQCIGSTGIVLVCALD